MQLNKRCFKIDKTNAKAMIDGYLKNGMRVHQSIWCAVDEIPFPALVTLNRTKTKFPMSREGEQLHPDFYTIPYKYIAKLPRPHFQYFIKNDMNLWEILCSNGLFDVWIADAPYMRFANSKSPRSSFRIQLVRIYEINEVFRESDIRHVSDRIDHLCAANTEVTIKRPVISDEEFERMRNHLEESVAEFLISERRNDL